MADPIKSERAALTYEDYITLPNDRNRYEILEGELVVTPSPSFRHQDVSQNLEFLLSTHIKQNRSGKMVHAPMDVILGESIIVQPDIIFISRDRYNLITKRGVEGPPDLLIEILSPSTAKYDRLAKLKIYARYGVRWYWIVNPDEEVLQEYALKGDIYELAGSYSHGDKFRPALFPGLDLSLAEIWA